MVHKNSRTANLGGQETFSINIVLSVKEKFERDVRTKFYLTCANLAFSITF